MSGRVGIPAVEVLAWGSTVGAVALDPATEFYAFEYAPEWIATGRELAPLHLPSRPGTFVFPELSPVTFHRLPALLADALPDRFGNALVDARLAEEGVGPDEITPLDRLAYAASRAMGALEFRPPRELSGQDVTAIQLADLVLAARRTVAGDLTTPDGATDAIRQLIHVGTSAGGARAKAVVSFNPGTGQIRSGHAAHEPGFEPWLIKLDGVSGDPSREQALGEGEQYTRIEYAYSLMARAAGIEMTECRLLPEGPRTHFMTRRFDRTDDGARHHVQTLCAMAHLDFNLPAAHSYSQYLNTVDALGLGREARAQAYRRVVFNVAAVNRDDHTKNLAFLLPEDGDWRLAPAYDVTHAHNPGGAWTRQHQMSVNGKRDGITLADLEELGDRAKVPGYRAVIGEVLAAVDTWPAAAEEAGVSPAALAAVAADLAAHRPT